MKAPVGAGSFMPATFRGYGHSRPLATSGPYQEGIAAEDAGQILFVVSSTWIRSAPSGFSHQRISPLVTCRDTILAIRQASPILVHPGQGYLTVSAIDKHSPFEVAKLFQETSAAPITRQQARRLNVEPGSAGMHSAALFCH